MKENLFSKETGGNFYNQLSSNERLREFIESQWRIYGPHAPKEFLKAFVNGNEKTEALLWEMLLGNKFLKNGCTLKPAKSEDGPDLCVAYNDQYFYVECSLPRPKQYINFMNTRVRGPAVNLNDDDVKETDLKKKKPNYTSISELATIGSITEKCNPSEPTSQNNRWSDKVINKDKPFIMAIHGRYQCLQANGDAANFVYSTKKKSIKKIVENDSEGNPLSDPYVIDISPNLFENDRYAHVAGIIYSQDWLPPFNGRNYVYIPNKYARNPLKYTPPFLRRVGMDEITQRAKLARDFENSKIV